MEDTAANRVGVRLDSLVTRWARRAAAGTAKGRPPWTVEVEVTVPFASRDLVTLRMVDANSGGAHPNAYVTYRSVRPLTRVEVNPRELFTDSLAATAIVERFFRREREFPPAARLDSLGFFDDTRGRVVLPAQIGVLRDTLEFFYNASEIAAYVQGPTLLAIPRDSLRSVLKR